MKRALAISLILLCGCQKRHPAQSAPQAEIPIKCIYPVQLPSSNCTQITDELFECNHIVVRAECVQFKAQQHADRP